MSDTEVKNFDLLPDKGIISLTTYYKSGKGVSTPVEFIKYKDKLYASTRTKSYKVKRLRSSSKATVAECNMRGIIQGPTIAVKAKVLDEDDPKALEAANIIYSGFFWKLMFIVQKITFWRTPSPRVIIEMTR